jgi:cation diffusion facilitator family transporter
MADESLLTVVIAFTANLAVAIAKTGAALITGSASLVAEAAHSWADTGNEIFLIVAERRSRRDRDSSHPQGYGKEAYVWSMFAAFGIFSAGAVLSVQHGVQELISGESSGSFWLAYLVLGLSAILEGISFLRSLQQVRKAAREHHHRTIEQVIVTSNPTLRAVFAEDAAALIGLGLAFLGILLHQLTGSAVYDAAGSICIGLLLAGVAIVLIERNRQFLLGQPIEEETRQLALQELLDRPDVDRVTYLHIEYAGPETLFLVAAIDVAGNQPEDKVANTLRRIEHDIENDPHVAEAVLTLSSPDDASLIANPPVYDS